MGRGPAPPTVQPEPVRVQVLTDGQVQVDGMPVAASELVEVLRFAHRQAPQAAMQLQASDEADYGRFAQVLAAGRNAGFTDIAFPR